MKALLACALVVMIAGCKSTGSSPTVVARDPLPKTLEQAVQSQLRTPENMARDRYRHPLETLNFFELKPDMTVIEIWPGSGWYGEILAPYLSERGHYVAAISKASAAEMQKHQDKFTAW